VVEVDVVLDVVVDVELDEELDDELVPPVVVVVDGTGSPWKWIGMYTWSAGPAGVPNASMQGMPRST
jgi:hypothetical protein